MIQITELKKKFGKTIACDIPSFTINDGDILGLVGNNGAGKTTLFRMILDLLNPDAGTITIDGINPALSEEWKNTTGAHIDEGFLIDYLTPEEYFEFIAKISNLPQSVKQERIDLFKSFAGEDILGQNKLIRNLSAGNKQKVGIISALLRHPKLVILDEPFNYLDPTSQNKLKKLLTDYASTNHATLLISSHNLQHTVDISTRIALLEKGQIKHDFQEINSEAQQELENYFNAPE